MRQRQSENTLSSDLPSAAQFHGGGIISDCEVYVLYCSGTAILIQKHAGRLNLAQ